MRVSKVLHSIVFPTLVILSPYESTAGSCRGEQCQEVEDVEEVVLLKLKNATPAVALQTENAASSRAEADAEFWSRRRRVASGQGPLVVTPRERPGNDPNDIWRGFGTSLIWWANGFGDTEIADALSDIFFSLKESTTLKLLQKSKGVTEEDLPGLGLTVARYNAGGSSDTPNRRGQTMVRGEGYGDKDTFNARVMHGFWINAANATADYDPKTEDPTDTANWDWTVDAAQVAMLKKAKERGADTFELFSNSPMWWMLNNHNTAGGPCDETNPLNIAACISTTDNLRRDMFGAQAHYLTEVWKHAAENWGVKFNTIAPFNEPRANWWQENNHQEGCHFKIQTQSDFVKVLHDAMAQKGILKEASICASDENGLAGDHPVLMHFGMFNKAYHSYQNLLQENTARFVDQVSVHGYAWQYYGFSFHAHKVSDDGQYANYDSIFVRDEFRRLTSGKLRFMSEYGRGHMPSGYPHPMDDFTGLQLARVIIMDIKWLQPSMWATWQMMDRSSSWGLIKGSPTQRNVDGATGGFFVYAQFTRHIRPGMKILETNPYPSESTSHHIDPAEDDDMTLVAISADKIVVVVGPAWPQGYEGWDAERGSTGRQFKIDLEAFQASGEAQVWCTYTGDIVLRKNRRSKEREPNNFKLRKRKYDQWRKTKYQKVNPVKLDGSTLPIDLPTDTVCTYEVPRA
mmetsp:Transcript_78960/g.231782  ORF Transcript_78960/g.231782 Transcript_78960/m.231782 type:complete len:686 (+) Transcript_78960:95-2152(+)